MSRGILKFRNYLSFLLKAWVMLVVKDVELDEATGMDMDEVLPRVKTNIWHLQNCDFSGRGLLLEYGVHLD